MCDAPGLENRSWPPLAARSAADRSRRARPFLESGHNSTYTRRSSSRHAVHGRHHDVQAASSEHHRPSCDEPRVVAEASGGTDGEAPVRAGSRPCLARALGVRGRHRHQRLHRARRRHGAGGHRRLRHPHQRRDAGPGLARALAERRGPGGQHPRPHGPPRGQLGGEGRGRRPDRAPPQRPAARRVERVPRPAPQRAVPRDRRRPSPPDPRGADDAAARPGRRRGPACSKTATWSTSATTSS